jgi:hypothetical protein
VRVGHLALLPGAFEGPLWLETALAGSVERFVIEQAIEHGAPVSMLVSSTTSLGGASGMIHIGGPAACAAVPMLHHRRVGSHHLTRLLFSLAEVDDTFRDGGALLPFTMRISTE